MTYELRVERWLDAPPEVVFDTFVDPDAQQELFAGPEGDWRVESSEIDLRVGGTWTVVAGPPGREPDRLTYVFTEIERPRRLAATLSMQFAELGRTDHSEVSLAFDERDGGTFLILVQSGFETEAQRDEYLSGAPGFLDALERTVATRTARKQP